MPEFNLLDLWRIRNPDTNRYSWTKIHQDGMVKASRIDLMLVSAGFDTSVENVTYLPAPHTDHSAIFTVISTSQNKRGTGYWKLNTSLLSNTDFVRTVNSDMLSELHHCTLLKLDPSHTWERVKKTTKNSAIQESRKLSSERKLAISQMLEKIEDLETNMPLNQKEAKLLLQSKQDLDDLLNEQIQGTIFRTKAKWAADGEKPTKYFLNMEKLRYNAKTCQTLIHQDTLLYSDSEILDALKEFYINLYHKDPDTVNFDLVNNTDIRCPEHLLLKRKSLLQLASSVKTKHLAVTVYPSNFTCAFGTHCACPSAKWYTMFSITKGCSKLAALEFLM